MIWNIRRGEERESLMRRGSPWSSLENTKYTLLSPKGIKTIYALVPPQRLELLHGLLQSKSLKVQ